MNKEEEIENFRRNVLPEYQEILKQEKEINPYFDKHGFRVKQCRICGEYKRLSAFYKNLLKKFGRFDECKQCLKFIRMKKDNFLKL